MSARLAASVGTFLDMPRLQDLLPDTQLIVNMPAGDLAGYVLEVLLSSKHGEGLWQRRNFCGAAGQAYAPPREGGHQGVMQACAEAWSWLEANGLICRDPNQDYDWYVPTRRAKEVSDRNAIKALIASQELPEHFLHPEIVQHARPLFLQGRLDTAVFEAFKTLEVEIRTAAGLDNDLIGIALAGRAFHPDNGPLTAKQADQGERTALRNLMVGALGSYKNPSSHRRVDLNAASARELLLFASQLLRIVDERRPK